MKRFNSPSAAKLNIKFHQLLAGTRLSIIRVHTNIEKLGFLRHIPKTYKTDHPLLGSALYPQYKTIGKRISHLFDEHTLRPEGEGVATFYGDDLIQILDAHFLNSHFFAFHFFQNSRRSKRSQSDQRDSIRFNNSWAAFFISSSLD